MKLMPLMDRRGDATAWADRNSRWVSDPDAELDSFSQTQPLFAAVSAARLGNLLSLEPTR